MEIARENQIIIKHQEFPEPFYISGEELLSCPKQIVKSRSGNDLDMVVVPLKNLKTDLILGEL